MPSAAEIGAFWERRLSLLAETPPEPRVAPTPDRSTDTVHTSRVTLRSAGEVDVCGWLCVPRDVPGRLPALIEFPGYDGAGQPPVGAAARGAVALHLAPRGQGISAPHFPLPEGQQICIGLESPEAYYYGWAFCDAIRGVDFLASLAEVDAGRIAAQGGSQGGGLALALAALDTRIRVVAAAVPFLCGFDHAIEATSDPLCRIARALAAPVAPTRQQALATLAHFDVVNLAHRLECPALVSIHDDDEVCLPGTIAAAFERIPTRRMLIRYPGLGHCGNIDFARRAWSWIEEHW